MENPKRRKNTHGFFVACADLSCGKSDSAGRTLINKYGNFFIDYFHSKTKKYDYDAKLKLQSINF